MKENIQAIIKHFNLIFRRGRSTLDREEHEGAELLTGREGLLLWKKNEIDWDLGISMDQPINFLPLGA